MESLIESLMHMIWKLFWALCWFISYRTVKNKDMSSFYFIMFLGYVVMAAVDVYFGFMN